MTKLLIVFLIVVVLIVLLVGYMLRRLRKIISPFYNPVRDNIGNKRNTGADAEVIYNKDEVVVLKGEAKRQDDSSRDK